MPSSCCAVGCKNRCSKKKGIKLYTFPKDPVRREQWECAVRREGWKANKYSRICSAHFVSRTIYTVSNASLYLSVLNTEFLTVNIK